MKLTKFHKAAFVSSVMNDVPKIDYQDQLRKIIDQDMLDSSPKEVVAALKCKIVRPLLLKSNETWSPDYHISTPDGDSVSRYKAELSSITVYAGFVPSEKARVKLNAICLDAAMQSASRQQLEAKVEGAINGCTTLKQAHERLPEFVKYLPAEAAKSNYLPAIANLAADLCKAGWPKGKSDQSSVTTGGLVTA